MQFRGTTGVALDAWTSHFERPTPGLLGSRRRYIFQRL